MKPFVRIREKNWQSNLLLNFLKQKSLNEIRSKPIIFSDDCDLSFSENKETNNPIAASNSTDNTLFDIQCIKKYKLSELILEIDNNNIVLSIVVSAGKYYTCYYIVEKKYLAELYIDVNFRYYQNGVWFHKINLADRDHYIELSVIVYMDYYTVLLSINIDGFTLYGIIISD